MDTDERQTACAEDCSFHGSTTVLILCSFCICAACVAAPRPVLSAGTYCCCLVYIELATVPSCTV